MLLRFGRRSPAWIGNMVVVGALSIVALSAMAAGCSSAGLQCKAVVPATTCNGESLEICADVSSNVCYFQTGSGARAATCGSCNEFTVDEDCMSAATSYCGSGSGSGSGGGSGSSSGGGGISESCGGFCPDGSTCSYQTNENDPCDVGCSGGSISYVTESFGTNCSPESCPGSTSSCLGNTYCDVTMTDAVCVTDPCEGTVKTGTITITCSSGSSSGSSGSSSGGGSTVACGASWASVACANCITANCCSQAQNCAGDPSCRVLDGCLSTCNGDVSCASSCQATAGSTATTEYDNFAACYVPACEGTCGSAP